MTQTVSLKNVSDSRAQHKNDPQAAFFTGRYVNELRDVAVAAMFAGVHASFQSPPGWGKTDILSNIARTVAGSDHFNRIDLMPSSSPSAFTGLDDPQELINNGRLVKVTDKTPYDPNMRVILADELFRANDPTFDAGLHALDPQKQDHCVVFAANNFVAKGERVEALLDRIALWYWMNPAQTLDVEETVSAMMTSVGKPAVPGWMPTWDMVEAVRAAKPGPKATAAIRDYISVLVEEGTQEGFAVGHPRSLAQWWRILFYNAVAVTGDENFSNIPAEVTKLIGYAYGSASYQEARKWSDMVAALADKVQAEVDRILTENVEEFKRVAAISDLTQRTSEAMNLGSRLANAQTTLFTQFGKDEPRVQEALRLLTQWHSAAVMGQTTVFAERS